MKFANAEVGDLVEVTHHAVPGKVWYSAKVVRVTACFIDVLRDDWAGRPHRYRRVDGREVSGYCGFYSHVRVKETP